jgi:uncharacterized protein with HEPN domain
MPLDSDDVARLRDITTFGSKVATIVAGVPRERFAVDSKTLFATCYGIQVVGEAAWKLSTSFKQTQPSIPWPLISSMRHHLVHDYGRTDETIIFQVATIPLPLLTKQVMGIIAAEASQP